MNVDPQRARRVRRADPGHRRRGVSYPPEPWHLRGQLHLTAWRVPVEDLPALPPGVLPVQLGGSALVGTAWAIYEPGGVLSYRELLAVVLVRAGARPQVSITHAWVDSEASLHGGRELWGIPKELASFRINGPEYTAYTQAHELIARGRVRGGAVLPGRWPAGCTVAQQLTGELAQMPARSTSRLRLIGSRWEFAAAGPLAWLTAARPLGGISLLDFVLRFGPRRGFGRVSSAR